MDFEEVVTFALAYLREHNAVGEGVIRDLRTKSKQLGCAPWMLAFKGAIPHKTYEDIHRLYVEHRKHENGFSRVDDKQLAAIRRFYADPFLMSSF